MHVLHVLVGDNDADFELFQSLDETTDTVDDWVVPKTALIGDEVIFFFHNAGFVAFGKVASKPREGESHGRPAYRSIIDSIERFARPVPLGHIREAVPHWGWLNQRVKSRTTPKADVVAALLKAIRAYK